MLGLKRADILAKMTGALDNLKMELKKDNPNRKAEETEEMNTYFD